MIVTVLGEHEALPCWRVISPLYAGTPTSGMGAARRGGRFNRPRQEALYLSTDEATALAEYRQDNPWLPPGTICTFFARQLRVADLSAGFDPTHWDAVWSDFAIDWRESWFGASIEPPTWYMSDDVLTAGLDGILFPSQARAGGTNLVLFDSSALPRSRLEVYDPGHVLGQLDDGPN